MRRIAGFLLVTSLLISAPSAAHAAPSDVVIGLWPQTFTQFNQIRAASGISIPYFRGRMRDGQFDSKLAPPDDLAAAAAGYSIGMNIQPKTGSGANRTGILYTDISAQLQAGSGPYYDKLVSFAHEVLALPTYGVVPNYLQFHSEANIQAAPGVLDPHPYSGTGPEYQQCYALIHQLFDSLGVTNKIYWQIVLTRAAYGGNQGGPQNWYPSDPSLYDLVGVDAYYQSPGWFSPSSAFDAAFAFAQSQGKKVWIDETGADEGGPTHSPTAKAAWFGSLGSYLASYRQSLAGVVFSHSADGGDWFLDSELAGDRTVPNYTGTTWTGWVTAMTPFTTFVPPRTLSVTTTGSGGGSVVSSPSGIDCGTTCSVDLPDGTSVALTATASSGSIFTGWSGGPCSGTGMCNVTMDAGKSVTATFTLATHTLSVTTTGSGTGTVTSDVGGIDCGATCSADYDHGTSVVLSAAPDANVTFAGWSGGGCSGTTDCTVTMDAAKTVNAQFDLVQHLLSATKQGNGSGSVTSSTGGINCPGMCGVTYAHGTVVTLTANVGANSVFAGWGGECGGVATTCTITMDAGKSVTATFTLVTHTLSVTTTGTGTGTVASDVGGIDCGTTCSADYDHGTGVVLSATPDANVIFAGWSGGGCSGTADCTVTMGAAKSVNAEFDLAQQLLVVTTQGTGAGTVTSDTGDINCPGACGATYEDGLAVTLTATQDANSSFAGWSGACAGTGICIVSMDGSENVTATFTLLTRTLSITTTGSGTGTVTSDVGGIDCGTTCAASYDHGTVVVLSAAPDANVTFAGWSGGGCSGTTDCTVTMDAAKNVTATFSLIQHPLTVTKSGAGTGTITSGAGGINCGPTCSANFDHGTSVALHATPGANSVFIGWIGGGCAGNGDCTVPMDAAMSVDGHFDLVQRLLSVTKSGNGNGTLTSDVGGVNCPGTCAASYTFGSAVVLTANPGANSVFTGWSGGVCSGTNTTCDLTMDAGKNVTATFALITHTLSISKSGNGTGAITSNVGGISCGTTCAADYDHGTSVVLSATPDANVTFAGWIGGGCSGTTDCTVTMDAAKTVNAQFDLVQHLLSATKQGNGSGSVTSSTGGINCPGTCGVTYAHGTVVTLTANVGANSVFAAWGGSSCTGAATTCTITMDAAKNVTATFSLIQHILTVTKSGAGAGTITSGAGGINCPGTCSANYDHGSLVVLTATPTGGSTFAGWSGGGCSGTGPCNVMMNAATAVTGTFNPPVTANTLRDNDPTVAYNGWFGAADVAANGGFYRTNAVRNDTVTWTSPATTSITWVTRTGPAQGKASVTIDGKNEGTFDLYTSAQAPRNEIFSGLANKAHTVVIKTLFTKNAASSNYNVRLDAFVAGGVTTQESDPSVQYDSWKSAPQALATDGTYRSSATATATVTVSFTGSAIDWVTTKGKGYGKASVAIDGVNKGTVDLYQSATAWQSHVTYAGLSAGTHTMVIQVLGQKNANATGKTVVVDGFIVHAP